MYCDVYYGRPEIRLLNELFLSLISNQLYPFLVIMKENYNKFSLKFILFFKKVNIDYNSSSLAYFYFNEIRVVLGDFFAVLYSL